MHFPLAPKHETTNQITACMASDKHQHTHLRFRTPAKLVST